MVAVFWPYVVYRVPPPGRGRSTRHGKGREDGRRSLLRGLERDEVPRARNEPEIQVGEGLLYRLGPGGGLDGVPIPPPHHRGDAYRVFAGGRVRPLVRGPVPAEAGLYGAGPREGVHYGPELLRADALLR